MEKEYKNILEIHNRQEFRNWLKNNSQTEKECFVFARRGKPNNEQELWYLDAVEEALCFGWIDSTNTNINGRRIQRFSPRKKDSNWTELNKERARRLIKLGLMTEEGIKVLPNMGVRSFKINPKVERDLKTNRAWAKFKTFPPLYQRVRLYNLDFYLSRKMYDVYNKSLTNLIKATKQGKTVGEWNDYGRLLNY